MDNHTYNVSQSRVALLLQNPYQGGIERVLINLARGLRAQGILVDLLIRSSDTPFFNQLEPEVNVIQLAPAEKSDVRSALIGYCEQMRPAILLTGKEEDGAMAVSIKSALEVSPRISLGVHLNYTAQLNSRRAGVIRKFRRYRQIRKLYRGADTLICVSEGVCDDISRILKKTPVETLVLPNPVITPELGELAAQGVDHPWLREPGGVPVLLGVGRMGKIKNFPLLIKAFARVRTHRDCRLIILGDGRQRRKLVALAQRLGVADDVDFPGFVDNPYAYMSRSALFVLSSEWEGLPTVLIEALAVGIPVVSTDCPSGPSEILQGGRFGKLVPTGDEVALSDAIITTLSQQQDPQQLRDAVKPYTMEASCKAYIQKLGL